jgi:hypothetical protein
VTDDASNPYHAPDREPDRVDLGSEEDFARLNSATRVKAAGQVLFGLFFAGITALAGWGLALSTVGLAVGAGIGLAVGAGYVLGASRRWIRVGSGGLTLGGQLVPWSDVFFAESSESSAGFFFARRRRRTLYLCYVEGGEPRMVSLHVSASDPDWSLRIQERLRPWERLDEVERAFIRQLVGASPDGERAAPEDHG